MRISASSGETSSVGPAPCVAQQPRGDEVHGALAPPGALDEEDPAAVGDDGLDRLELPGPEGGVGAEHPLEDQLFGRCRHAGSMTSSDDTPGEQVPQTVISANAPSDTSVSPTEVATNPISYVVPMTSPGLTCTSSRIFTARPGLRGVVT